MNAIVCRRYGSPDVLQFKEVEKPTPKDDEVLIKVRAASVNSWDWDLLRGRPYFNRLGALRKPKYEIFGADIAGQVETVGTNVQQLLPGDEVFGDISGCGWGGFAEYVCACERVLALKPARMSFEEAAAVPQAAVLALQGLRNKGHIQAGQRVLINGAGGGVGTFAVQIAKSFGTDVTGVDSTRKLDMLRSIGADHVIDYTQEDFTKNGQRYDLILDVVANRSVFDYKRALNPGGIFVVGGGSTGRILQVVALGSWIARSDKKKLVLLVHRPSKEDLEFMKELYEAGKVVPVIDRQFPLREVPDALRYFGEGHVQGKIVITV